MITKDHIKYLKDTLEPDGDAYPWHELYEWDYKYLEAKSHQEDAPEGLKWEHRYSTLKQSGPLFNNTCVVDDLVWTAKSLDDFKIKVDLLGLPWEAVDFVICYIQLNPGRVFSYNWGDLMKNGQPPLPPFSSSRECTAWYIYDDHFKEISERSLPILEVEEFLKVELARSTTRL